MARRKKVTTPTMVAADGHGGCCEGAVIGRSGDGEPLLRRERDASDSDLVTVMLVMLGALKKPFFETPGTVMETAFRLQKSPQRLQTSRPTRIQYCITL